MTSLNPEIKSFTQFFQKIAGAKGRALGRTPQSAKGLYRSRAFRKVWKPCAIERVFTDWRTVQAVPEKFPVGSFRQQKPYFTNTDSWNIIFIDLFLMVSAQTAEKSPTGRFFWKVRTLCFSIQSLDWKIHPQRRLTMRVEQVQLEFFAFCGRRPKALPLDTTNFCLFIISISSAAGWFASAVWQLFIGPKHTYSRTQKDRRIFLRSFWVL